MLEFRFSQCCRGVSGQLSERVNQLKRLNRRRFGKKWGVKNKENRLPSSFFTESSFIQFFHKLSVVLSVAGIPVLYVPFVPYVPFLQQVKDSQHLSLVGVRVY